MPIFWRDYVRPAEHLPTLRDRKRDVYERIDEQGFGWKIVIVAGVGFLTDAYDIFAVNMVLPMLEIVYWQNKLPVRQETAINLALLVGTIIGQVGFGILADRYGRKKMYGWELLIVIVATVGLALCSKGARGSVNILAWVISWRLLMGIGIGADYPLSAVIVSEFSPRKHRARMLAAVFYMQPVGQCLANVVAIIVTVLSRRYISHDSDPSNCSGDCLETTDQIWRWIVGLGAVLPALALLARLFIPESPRYLLEVEKDSYTAQESAKKYFPEDPFEDDSEADHGNNQDASAVEMPLTEGGFPAQPGSIPMRNWPIRRDRVLGDESPPRRTDNSRAVTPPARDPDVIEAAPHHITEYLTPRLEVRDRITHDMSSPGSSTGKSDIAVEVRSIVPSTPRNDQSNDGHEYPENLNPRQLNSTPEHENSAPGNSEILQGNAQARKASWKEFWKGFYAFLFDADWTDGSTSEVQHINPETDGQTSLNNQPAPKRRWNDGNWTDLAGTCLTWFLLDFAFYFLGVNSWKVIAKVWDTPVYTSVYQLIIQFSWRALVSVSVSSLIGGAIFIAMARYRHKLQTYGFLILAAFFIAVGATFVTLLGGRYFAAVIVLYFFTQLFFDFGPNTSTFVIPAEVFPTQYRASCHGLSAAFGKLGSILAQVIAQVYIHDDDRSTRLGYALILFSAVMILGAIITKFWVPNPCDIYGKSRSLEELSRGKKARKEMERKEKVELQMTELARYGTVSPAV